MAPGEPGPVTVGERARVAAHATLASAPGTAIGRRRGACRPTR